MTVAPTLGESRAGGPDHYTYRGAWAGADPVPVTTCAEVPRLANAAAAQFEAIEGLPAQAAHIALDIRSARP